MLSRNSLPADRQDRFYKKQFLNDAIEWDIVNWTRAIEFWNIEDICRKDIGSVLEIGARRGGLSLLFADSLRKNGQESGQIICSDVNSPQEIAQPLHERYHLEQRISYRALDAVLLNEAEKYDVICFKSVLGGAGRNDNIDAQTRMMENIYRALKPGGILVFAENLTASPLHMFFRRHFIKWGGRWRYVSLEEALSFCKDFSNVRYKCFGFLGSFGRTEAQRSFLGHIDKCCDKLFGDHAKYIISVVAEK